MKENSGKILGTLLFVLLILVLIFLIFFRENKVDTRRVELIVLKNNNLLSEEDYFAYAKLNEKALYKNFTLPVIKDRIERHPYIKRADVQFKGLRQVNINLIEKSFKAFLLGGKEPYIITNDFEVLPLLTNTKALDLPVISNPKNSDEIIQNSLFRNEDMIQAFKILDAAELVDEKLKKKISEINLRAGRDILLTISGLSSSIIFGRKDETNKMIYLNEILNIKEEDKSLSAATYIDLRFNNYIYIGGFQTAGFTE